MFSILQASIKFNITQRTIIFNYHFINNNISLLDEAAIFFQQPTFIFVVIFACYFGSTSINSRFRNEKKIFINTISLSYRYFNYGNIQKIKFHLKIVIQYLISKIGVLKFWWISRLFTIFIIFKRLRIIYTITCPCTHEKSDSTIKQRQPLSTDWNRSPITVSTSPPQTISEWVWMVLMYFAEREKMVYLNFSVLSFLYHNTNKMGDFAHV